MSAPSLTQSSVADSTSANNDPTLDDVIVLEPTILRNGNTDNSGGLPTESQSDRTLSSGTSPEYVALLHDRLRAAAGFLAIAFLVFIVFAALTPGTGYYLIGPSLTLRGLLSVAVVGLLVMQPKLKYSQLRWIEAVYFSLLVLVQVIGNYQSYLQLIEQGNLIELIATQKNGIMRMWMLMMMYGVFIPNHPKRTAYAVLTMALAVLLANGIVMNRHMEVADSELWKTIGLNAGSNAVLLVVGAGLSIYTAYILHGLRSELHEARSLGQYRLLNKLDAGGMGEVYVAEHQLLKRPCAIKLINADLNKNSIAIARFEREVRSAAMLSHPNTIEIYDYGISEDGTFYYVMELLPGLSLSDLVRQTGPLPPGRVVYLMMQVCGSLAEAHRKGLVHRDIKPANIFTAILGGQCDVAKVLDFGLVKQEQPTDGQQLTADYTVSGTPSYMSPEQARGEHELDGRSDLYALGAVMYFLLTGRPPFQSDNPMSLMISHASDPVRPPTELSATITADLEAVVMRCLAKKPADRYADATGLSRALAACGCGSDWDQSRAEQWWIAQAEAVDAAV